MSEPVLGEAMGAGASLSLATGLKTFSLGILIGLFIVFAWLLVVMTRMPRSPREWVISLVATVVISLTGGSFIYMKFHLAEWGSSWAGGLVIGGCYFAAGLPAWAIIRWVFNFIEKREGADIFDVIEDLEGKFKK